MQPATHRHRIDHALDPNHIRRIPHIDIFFFGHLKHILESSRDLCIQSLHYLPFCPVKIHIILNALKIGGGHTTCVTKEIRNDEDIFLLEVFIGFGRGRTIRALRYNFDAARNLFYRLCVDLVLQCSGKEYIHIL
jgi:hypothetical protein